MAGAWQEDRQTMLTLLPIFEKLTMPLIKSERFWGSLHRLYLEQPLLFLPRFFQNIVCVLFIGWWLCFPPNRSCSFRLSRRAKKGVKKGVRVVMQISVVFVGLLRMKLLINWACRIFGGRFVNVFFSLIDIPIVRFESV